MAGRLEPVRVLKDKGTEGERDIDMNLSTLEYGPRQKPKVHETRRRKTIDDLRTRLSTGTDKAGELYRGSIPGLFIS